ncbi:hypothetical protein CBM2623_B90026 [Cupriavidus taiwanensis]|nr:hypothetical protein CBM2608_B100025 [Cupriavidus taiwanensis]SPA36601.1 hypothetical protein CBM2623_B90026 [Cupriavidus taiwanensis]SPA53831.1 hypothetical protein CBM2629_U10093 [Cupriavidus taiwanensis]
MFLARLQHAFDAGRPRFFSTLALAKRDSFLGHLVGPRHTEWVVYAKEPFGGPRQVLDYLGRYTHRVAISNSRLLARGSPSPAPLREADRPVVV